MKEKKYIWDVIWGKDICEYLWVLHKVCEEKSECHFIGINGPVGIGKKTLIKQVSEAIGRKFIYINYYIDIEKGDNILNYEENSLFYIEGITIENLNYPEKIKNLIHMIEENKIFKDSIIIFSSSSVIGYNTGLNVEFKVFLYNSLSFYEKIQYAHIIIKECQEKWRLYNVELPDDSIEILIKYYTKEAGINSLSDLIRRLYEAIYYENNNIDLIITNEVILKIIGSGTYVFDDQIYDMSLQGVGMAWTKWGGTLLPTELKMLKGNGEIIFYGNVGKAMRESVEIVLLYLKFNYKIWKIQKKDIYKKDFYINIYDASLYKDGSSAGLAFFIKFICAIRGIRFKRPIGFSGEFTLDGRILRVGGIKEKLSVALNHGISDFVLPKQSWGEFQLLPERMRKLVTITFVEHVKELEKVIEQERI